MYLTQFSTYNTPIKFSAMDKDTKIDEDIRELLSNISDWNTTYMKMYKTMREMKMVVNSLKEELKISREQEHLTRFKLRRAHANLSQIQELLKELSNTKDENHKLLEEKKSLEENYLEQVNKREMDHEDWEKEKNSIEESHNNVLQNVKKVASEDVYRIRCDLNDIQKDYERKLDEMRKKMTEKRQEYDEKISETISTYEAKLMKMNEELASAQTEIKNLRMRWTGNIYSLQKKPSEKDTINMESGGVKNEQKTNFDLNGRAEHHLTDCYQQEPGQSPQTQRAEMEHHYSSSELYQNVSLERLQQSPSRNTLKEIKFLKQPTGGAMIYQKRAQTAGPLINRSGGTSYPPQPISYPRIAIRNTVSLVSETEERELDGSPALANKSKELNSKIQKVQFPVTKKRKLFSRNDDFY